MPNFRRRGHHQSSKRIQYGEPTARCLPREERTRGRTAEASGARVAASPVPTSSGSPTSPTWRPGKDSCVLHLPSTSSLELEVSPCRARPRCTRASCARPPPCRRTRTSQRSRRAISGVFATRSGSQTRVSSALERQRRVPEPRRCGSRTVRGLELARRGSTLKSRRHAEVAHHLIRLCRPLSQRFGSRRSPMKTLRGILWGWPMRAIKRSLSKKYRWVTRGATSFAAGWTVRSREARRVNLGVKFEKQCELDWRAARPHD